MDTRRCRTVILKRGNRGGEPYGCLGLLPGEFPGCSTGGGTREEPRSLPELRKQSWESEQDAVARSSRTEYQREENWREGGWGGGEISLSLQLNTDQYIPVKKPLEGRKRAT